MGIFLAWSSYGKPLVVGMELSYPPFEMTDEKGEPSGVSVELARALAKSLKQELKIENMSYDGLIPALQTKKVDCVISSMTRTPEREKVVAFSEPYFQTGLALLISKNSKVESSTDLDSAGKTVAVKKGTTGHAWANQNLKKAKILVLDKESAAALEVSQGKADAFIYDQISTYQNGQKFKDSTRTNLEAFKNESWAVAVQKENLDLVSKINAFLEQFRKDKGFEKLGDQFLSEYKVTFKKLNIPFFF